MDGRLRVLRRWISHLWYRDNWVRCIGDLFSVISKLHFFFCVYFMETFSLV